MRKKLGFALVIPFDQYVKAKDDWHSNHRKARIIEEIKNLFVGVMEAPVIPQTNIYQEQFSIRQQQQQVLMIAWAVVYEEEIKGELPAMANGKIIITQA